MNRFFGLAALSAALLLCGCGPASDKRDAGAMWRESVQSAVKGGDWKNALALARDASKAAKDDPDFLVMYGICLERTGNAKDAVKAMRKAVQMAPGNFTARLSLGRMLLADDAAQQAIEHLRKACELQPEDIDAKILLARCSAKLASPDTVKNIIALMKTDRFKDSPDAYNELAIYFAATGQLDKARKSFAKALSLSEGKSPLIVLNMAIFNDLYLRDPQTARRYYASFLNLSAANPAFDAKRSMVERRQQTQP